MLSHRGGINPTYLNCCQTAFTGVWPKPNVKDAFFGLIEPKKMKLMESG
jgi:hypothetical protein